MKNSRDTVRRRRALLLAILLAPPVGIAGCGARSSSTDSPTVLLFTGSGTSPNDAVALESILREHRIRYATADSRQLGAMSVPQLRSYQLLIVPGGNFEAMGNGLSATATANVRTAVGAGLNYLGLCAGAFLAGNSPYNGLNLTSGVRFEFYSAERQGVRKAPMDIAIAGSSPIIQYWEDGPQLTGWGDVIGKYPDGTPAIVEGNVGDGWVILTGTHPEAPESWRHGLSFPAPASVSRRYAATLIDAALNRRSLEHF
jgi:glutamine amidotransferase-like uncharacterized protein